MTSKAQAPTLDSALKSLDEIGKIYDEPRTEGFGDVCDFYNKKLKSPLDIILNFVDSGISGGLFKLIPQAENVIKAIKLVKSLLEQSCTISKK